jgi:hypothetical protein
MSIRIDDLHDSSSFRPVSTAYNKRFPRLSSKGIDAKNLAMLGEAHRTKDEYGEFFLEAKCVVL